MVLIRELNNNIAKVVELYRELSVRRVGCVHPAGALYTQSASNARSAASYAPVLVCMHSFVGAAGEAAGRA